jgi:hypothetical protein
MKTLTCILIAIALISCSKEDEQIVLTKQRSVNFIIESNIGVITQAYMAEALDSIKLEIKQDVTYRFEGLTTGDTTLYLDMPAEFVRIYLIDNNGFKYYTPAFIAVEGMSTYQIRTLTRHL